MVMVAVPLSFAAGLTVIVRFGPMPVAIVSALFGISVWSDEVADTTRPSVATPGSAMVNGIGSVGVSSSVMTLSIALILPRGVCVTVHANSRLAVAPSASVAVTTTL